MCEFSPAALRISIAPPQQPPPALPELHVATCQMPQAFPVPPHACHEEEEEGGGGNVAVMAVDETAVVGKEGGGVDEGKEGEEEVGKDEWLHFYFNPLTPVECPTDFQLNLKTLPHLPRNVVLPSYRMAAAGSVYEVQEWIVHIGVGGFHRSHQLVYLDDLMKREEEQQTRWGVCGVGLTAADRKVADALSKQDYLYTVLTRSSTISEARVIGCLCDYVYVPDDPERILTKLADVHTRIVSLTVTEKGYCQNTEKHLDVTNALIKSDLNDLSIPRSAIGLIVAGLRRRKELGVAPFTVLSCDNLQDNGYVTRTMVMEFAQLLDPSLALWIEENVKFPNTMVDRITPVTAAEHKAILYRDFGVRDEWPVVTEEFRQWVIEDNFCNVRPSLEQVGVLFTNDIRPYEMMKLRLLNGGHSFLAYVSYLAGYRFVDDAVNDVLVSSFLRRYMDEMTSTIKGVNVELERYKEKLVERFGNKLIKDSLARIAEDGSTKFFNTMRDAILELISEHRHIYCSAFALACFLMYMTGVDEQLQPIEVKDPKHQELQALAIEVMSAKTLLPATLRKFLEVIFGDCPISSGVLVNEMTVAFAAIRRCGVREVLCSGGPLHGLFKHKLRTMRGTMELLEFVNT
eukprot:GHVS01014574.1.p1 GENE.GHVS01014574.1~~GHVS01014574.1.p1  ORF type:complete len:629 (+),score=128.26 GHVS01014574.1:440-2326(+)